MITHPIIDWRSAIAEAWARHAELVETAFESDDPDDYEAASEAWLEAVDLCGEANELGELS